MEDREEGTKEKTGRKKVSLKKISLGVKIWLKETVIMVQRKVEEDDVLQNVPIANIQLYKRSYYQLLMGVKVEGEFTQTLKNQGARGYCGEVGF